MLNRFRIRFVVAAAVLAALASSACEQVPLGAPTRSTISVSAGTSALAPGGTTEIRAFVIEEGGTPVQNGTLVRFTATLGTVSPVEVETRGGTAVTTFTAAMESGVARVRATSGSATGGDGDSPTNLVEIQVGVSSNSTVTLSASPARVSSGGTTTLTASVLDANGNRITAQPVIFSTTAGTLSTTSATTDSSGEARVRLTTTREATVTATAGAKTATAKVEVGSAASVSLSVSPANPTSGQAITLTVTPTIPAGGQAPRVVVTWGDGGQSDMGVVSAARSTTHVYSSSGTYNIAAVATADGESATSVTTITVGSPTTATIALSTSPASPTAGQAMTLTVTPTIATGGLAPRVVVNWGDGTTTDLGTVASARTATHVYTSAGTYSITATATAEGISTASTTVTIATPTTATVSLSTTPANPTVGQSVELTVTPTIASGGQAPRVVVNWGDETTTDLGTVAAARVVRHIYSTAGTHTITATATAEGTSTASTTVTVAALPPIGVNVSASSNSPQRCQSVTFTAAHTPTTESISTYHWSINSNTDSEDETSVRTTGNSLTRVFRTTGTKAVSVVATTPDGRQGTGQTQISVITETTACPP